MKVIKNLITPAMYKTKHYINANLFVPWYSYYFRFVEPFALGRWIHVRCNVHFTEMKMWIFSFMYSRFIATLVACVQFGSHRNCLELEGRFGKRRCLQTCRLSRKTWWYGCNSFLFQAEFKIFAEYVRGRLFPTRKSAWKVFICLLKAKFSTCGDGEVDT